MKRRQRSLSPANINQGNGGSNEKFDLNVESETPNPVADFDDSSDCVSLNSSENLRQIKSKMQKRVLWADVLHQDFVSVIFAIGLKNATAGSILETSAALRNKLSVADISKHLHEYATVRKHYTSSLEKMKLAKNEDGLLPGEFSQCLSLTHETMQDHFVRQLYSTPELIKENEECARDIIKCSPSISAEHRRLWERTLGMHKEQHEKLSNKLAEIHQFLPPLSPELNDIPSSIEGFMHLFPWGAPNESFPTDTIDESIFNEPAEAASPAALGSSSQHHDNLLKDLQTDISVSNAENGLHHKGPGDTDSVAATSLRPSVPHH